MASCIRGGFLQGPERTMQLFVRGLTGETLPFVAQGDWKVERLKEKLQVRCAVEHLALAVDFLSCRLGCLLMEEDK